MQAKTTWYFHLRDSFQQAIPGLSETLVSSFEMLNLKLAVA
jgi:hypothetical protein